MGTAIVLSSEVLQVKNFLVFTGVLSEIDDSMFYHSNAMDPVPVELCEYIKKWKTEDEDAKVYDSVYGTVCIEQDDIFDICDYYPSHSLVRTGHTTYILKGSSIDICEYICNNYKDFK